MRGRFVIGAPFPGVLAAPVIGCGGSEYSGRTPESGDVGTPSVSVSEACKLQPEDKAFIRNARPAAAKGYKGELAQQCRLAREAQEGQGD
jgi:hypothetical protein